MGGHFFLIPPQLTELVLGNGRHRESAHTLGYLGILVTTRDFVITYILMRIVRGFV